MIDPLQLLLDQAAGSASRFPENSRYRHVPLATTTLANGSTVCYLRRRFVPQPESLATLTAHRLLAGDRLDNLAAHYHGDPELFWQIADANRAMRPAALTAVHNDQQARILRITFPAGVPGQRYS